jgi:hypothetical protein
MEKSRSPASDGTFSHAPAQDGPAKCFFNDGRDGEGAGLEAE